MNEKETVLITGASSGIGRELAFLFARDGSHLVLVARRKERLEAVASELKQQYGVQALILPADLSQREAPQQIARTLEEQGVEIDVLVNNAGFGLRGAFVDLELERQLQMIRVNVTALTHLTGLFLPGMFRRGRGGVLNVASTAAFQPGPYMAVYYATKAYVLSFTEALHEELQGTGIQVTCLAPGATRTEFARVAHMESTLLFKLRPMDAGAVAEAGYRGFRAGKRLVIPGFRNKLGAFLVRFTPRGLILKVVKQLQV